MPSIPLLGALTLPQTPGDVGFDDFDNYAANDLINHGVYPFLDTSTKIGLSGVMPGSWPVAASAVAAKVTWITTGVSPGAVIWGFGYVKSAVLDTMDAAAFTEEVQSSAITAPATGLLKVVTSLTLTSGNFVAGDSVQFTLFRRGDLAGDTLAAAALVAGLEFDYTAS